MIVGFAAALLCAFPAAAQSAKIKVLHNFGATGDGAIPYGPVLLDPKGNVYGVTLDGGMGQCSDYGCGTVYELSPHANAAWGEKILQSFTSASSPWGGLIFDAAGNLYGTTIGSGSEAYELSPGASGWTLNAIYTNGAGPGLLMDHVGNLYGSIGLGDYFGLGALGELSPGSGGWTYTQFYGFTCANGCTGGYNPPGPPIWDASGNLWGTMARGGITQSPCVSSDGCGVLFEMTPNGDGTWAYHVIHDFASTTTDGQFPDGSLVRDAAGNFYGVTSSGGAFNHGTVFRFSFTGGAWQQSVLYDFPNCVQSCVRTGTLALDKAGNLYGASGGGVGEGNCGPLACGVIYKLSPQGNGRWKFALVHKFVGADGGLPLGVVLDTKGNLYGVTFSFGAYGAGTAFEITP
jgi:uncharacterized repeat protein (TIGR03803 family)